MAKIINFTLALMCFFLCLCSLTTAWPSSDNERYADKELNHDLINWLSAMNNPCRYYAANALNAPMPKRNSELINSLLSLPKNMNDAGK